MQTWEYLTITREWFFTPALKNNWSWRWLDDSTKNVDERLKELGSQGWELVNVVAFERKNQPLECHYYFKRPTF